MGEETEDLVIADIVDAAMAHQDFLAALVLKLVDRGALTLQDVETAIRFERGVIESHRRQGADPRLRAHASDMLSLKIERSLALSGHQMLPTQPWFQDPEDPLWPSMPDNDD